MKELDFKEIGQKIRETRNQKNLTQEYVANVTGVNVSHISNVENAKIGVSLTLLLSICNALGVTMDYILQNEYCNPTNAIEKELLNTIKDLENDKKEILLRIAKVL